MWVLNSDAPAALLQAVMAQYKEASRQGFPMSLALSCVSGMTVAKAAERPEMQLSVSDAVVSDCGASF